MFGLVLALVFIVAPPSAGAAPQPQTPLIREDGIKIHAVARRVASPRDAAPALHWVAEPFPDAASVIVSNARVKEALIGHLSRLVADPECTVWVLENNEMCSLGERLR